AECLANADLPGAFLHRNQHDVHHADSAEAERDQSDTREEIPHAIDHPAEHQRRERRAPQADGLAIVGIEAVPARQHGADVLFERPLDVFDPPATTLEHPGQLVDDKWFRRHYDIRHFTWGC